MDNFKLSSMFQKKQEADFGDGCCAPTQKRLWNLFENPHHSSAAKVNYSHIYSEESSPFLSSQGIQYLQVYSIHRPTVKNPQHSSAAKVKYSHTYSEESSPQQPS